MAGDPPKDWHEMMVATYTIVGELSRRMDSHSKEYSDNFREVFSKLDELKDIQHSDKEELLKKIQEVELSSAKSEGNINSKIALVNGSLSLLVAGATTWVMNKLGHQ